MKGDSSDFRHGFPLYKISVFALFNVWVWWGFSKALSKCFSSSPV